MAKRQLGTDYPEATERLDRGVLGFFSAAERLLLVIISLLTMLAVALERVVEVPVPVMQTQYAARR